ncbi:MAG: Kae1-associated kinase Bud32 [Thaumarchaeota archaeon]|nr:Kae1-associated kinase Bud32 [Nitrososphaerota archaeon]
MIQSTSHGEAEPLLGRLIYRGAEADLVRGKWQGLEAVFKLRKPLPYRHPVLDDAIRRFRTLREAEMIHSARTAGVLAPHLYLVDPPGSTLVMEFVRGARLKDVLSRASGKEASRLFESVGRNAAKLHGAGIMHGDLTTANMIVRGRDLYFIDFGLSLHTSRLEDHAVDIRLIKETLVGAHSEVSSLALTSLVKGYSTVAGPERCRAVIRQLRNIERRGRYARLD